MSVCVYHHDSRCSSKTSLRLSMPRRQAQPFNVMLRTIGSLALAYKYSIFSGFGSLTLTY